MAQRKLLFAILAAEVLAVAVLYGFMVVVPFSDSILSTLRTIAAIVIVGTVAWTLHRSSGVNGRLQYSLRTLVSVSVAICTGIVGLNCAGFGFSHSQYGPTFEAFIGGLALAGGSFGSVIGAVIRRPVLLGVIGAIATPIVVLAFALYQFLAHGPRC